jgi:hypothetical protein
MKIWPVSLGILLFANGCQAEQSNPVNTKQQVIIQASAKTVHVPKYKIIDGKTKNKELANRSGINANIAIEPDGPIRTITFADGTNTTVEPIRIIGRPSGFFDTDCAVRIDGGLIFTIGEEGTGTELLACYKLKEIGVLPDANNMRQFGLIYQTASLNADVINSIVLIEISPGNWAIDDAAFQKMEGSGQAKTIQNMARWINDHAKGQSKLAYVETQPKKVLEQSGKPINAPKYRVLDGKARNKELEDRIANEIDTRTEPDGPVHAIKFADNSEISVEPIKIFSRPGGWHEVDCAVRIDGGLTLTIGEKEKGVFCARLQEIGILPSLNAKRTIGLVYNIDVPKDNPLVSIVLTEISPGNWAVDEAAFKDMDDDALTDTIAGLAKWFTVRSKRNKP